MRSSEFLRMSSKNRIMSLLIRLKEEKYGTNVYRIELSQSQERRQTSNVVKNWMDQQEGIASSPPEQDRLVVDCLSSVPLLHYSLPAAASCGLHRCLGPRPPPLCQMKLGSVSITEGCGRAHLDYRLNYC